MIDKKKEREKVGWKSRRLHEGDERVNKSSMMSRMCWMSWIGCES